MGCGENTSRESRNARACAAAPAYTPTRHARAHLSARDAFMPAAKVIALNGLVTRSESLRLGMFSAMNVLNTLERYDSRRALVGLLRVNSTSYASQPSACAPARKRHRKASAHPRTLTRSSGGAFARLRVTSAPQSGSWS